MSIFQIRELWATSVGSNEEFHSNSICVGNVDGSNPPESKVIVGKFISL